MQNRIPFNRSIVFRCAILLSASMLATAAQAQPSFSKTFQPDVIGPGSASTLVFTISGDESAQAENLAFTDSLPAGVTIAEPGSPASTCGGTLSAPGGGSTISFSGGSVGPVETCQIQVDVTSSTFGTHTNVSGDLTSSAGNSGMATDDLTVNGNRPGFTKDFTPATVQFGARSTLTFQINNSANESDVFNLSFADDLPTGLEVAGPSNASTTCNGGVITADPGSGVISYGPAFSGDAAVAGLSTCTVSVDVTAEGGGMLANRSGDLTSVNGFTSVNSGKAIAALQVDVDELALIKSFTDDPVPPGGTVNLRFSITNFDRDFSATGITFSDDLDATLAGLVATGLPAGDVCGAGSTLDGTDVITLTGGNLGPGESCTIDVTLQVPAGTAPGAYPNTTSEVSGDVGGEPMVGAAASDDLVVDVIPILTKTFLDDAVGAGDMVDVEFSITNSSQSFGATDIAFTDNLTDFLAGTTPVGLPMNVCGGTLSQGTGSFGTTLLVFQSGSLAPGAMCTFIVALDIPAGMSTGTFTNNTNEITATVDGSTRTGPAASDTLDVVGAPQITKTFTDDPVDPGDIATLEFTISHDPESEEADPATDIAFTDDLDAALSGLTAVGLPENDVCGTGSSLSGTSVLSLTGGVLAPGESCTFQVTLQVPADAGAGFHTNTTSPVTAAVSGEPTTGLSATDDLLISGVELTKLFVGDPVLPGSTVILRFTISNDNPDFDATDISFTDNLEGALSGLSATALPQNDVCGLGSSISGTANLTFTGGNLAPGASCTFDVTLQVPAGAESATYLNSTSEVAATLDGTSIIFPGAQDDLVVDANLLNLGKEFTDDPAVAGGTVTLAFDVTNLSSSETITDIGFSDDLDAALSGLVSESGTITDVCGTGSELAGTSVLSLTGASLGPGESCAFSVTLRVPADLSSAGAFTNATSAPSGTVEGVTVEGAPASDDLLINAAAFSKTFDGPVAATGVAVLSFTIENLDGDAGLSGLSFTDDLDAILPGLAATGLPVSGICGSESQVSGSSIVTFTGGTLGPASSCTFNVTVQIPADAPPGAYLNTTSALTSAGLPVSTPASATLDVEPPPTFAKTFAPNAIAIGGTSTVTFVINNAASSLAATGLDFTDDLPAGLAVAATPNASTTCGGTLTATAGAGSLSLSGGSIAAGEGCTVSVDVTGTAEGSLLNTTSELTSSLGSSGTASDTINVVDSEFAVLKDFRTAPVIPGGLVEMELSIVNGSEFPLTDVSLTDDLGAVLPGLVAEGLPQADVCGAGSQVSGTSVVTLTGGSLAPGASCTVVVAVRLPADASSGDHVNTTSLVTGTREGVGVEADPATATLTVAPLAFSKEFLGGAVAAAETVTLRFTVDNPDPTNGVTGLSFTDDLDAVLPDLVAEGLPAADVCGTGSSMTGTSVLSLTGASLGPDGSCSFDVTIRVPADGASGDHVNTTSEISGEVDGAAISGTTATDVLTVAGAPDFSKAFEGGPIGVGEAATLTFTIDNSANTLAADDLAFTDNLPSGMTVADPPNAGTTCSGGAISASAGGESISYTGGSVAAGSVCIILVDVVANSPGNFENVTEDLSSSLGPGGNATASVRVLHLAPIPGPGPLALALLVLCLSVLGTAAARGRIG